MQIRFLPDTPIEDREGDSLGCLPFVELIKNSLEATETPYIYGVLGDWGAGKTSILRLLEKKLEPQTVSGCQFIPIWFNAWKYENEASMVYPLLHQIKQHYDRANLIDVDRAGFRERFKKIAVASALALTDLGLRVLTKQATGGGEGLGLEDVTKSLELTEKKLEAWSRALEGWTDQVAGIESAFQDLIEQYAGDYAKATGTNVDRVRFVILIDDLDRCLPDRAIAVLEGVKNFLSVKRCIFILGLNPEIVYAGMQVKYQGAKVNGREYLEKILNYSFYVPEPTPEAIAGFGVGHLSRLVSSPGPHPAALQSQFAQFGQILRECQFTNPRKIKRILNRYLLFLAQFAGDRFSLENISRLLIMAEYFPDLFQLYLSEAGPGDQLRHIGTPQFGLPAFEKASGLSLGGTYAQLTRMRPLFQLTNPQGQLNRANLREHAAKVFSLTRLK